MSDAGATRKVASSTVLFGVAAAFILLASLVGFVGAGNGLIGATWHLRGTLIPAAEAHVGA